MISWDFCFECFCNLGFVVLYLEYCLFWFFEIADLRYWLYASVLCFVFRFVIGGLVGVMLETFVYLVCRFAFCLWFTFGLLVCFLFFDLRGVEVAYLLLLISDFGVGLLLVGSLLLDVCGLICFMVDGRLICCLLFRVDLVYGVDR